MPFSHYVAYGFECRDSNSDLKRLTAVTANRFYVIPKYEVHLTVKVYFQKSLKKAFTITNFKEDFLDFLKSFSLDIDITERFKGKRGAKGSLVIENIGGIVSSAKDVIVAEKDKIKSAVESLKLSLERNSLASGVDSYIPLPPYLSILLDIVKEAPEWIAKHDQLYQALGLKEKTSDLKEFGNDLTDSFKKIHSEMKKPPKKRKTIKLGLKNVITTGLTTGLPKFTYTSRSELNEGIGEWEVERTVSRFMIDDAFGFWVKIDLALIILARIPIAAVALTVSNALKSRHLELSTDKEFLTGLSVGELNARNNTNFRVTLVIHGHLKATVTGTPLSMDIGSSKVNQLNYKNKAQIITDDAKSAQEDITSIGYTDYGNIKTEFDAGIWAEGKVYIFYGGLDASLNLSANFFLCDAYAMRRRKHRQPDFISDACCFFNGLSVAWRVEIYGGLRFKGHESKDKVSGWKGYSKVTELSEQQISEDQITDPIWRGNRLKQLAKERAPWVDVRDRNYSANNNQAQFALGGHYIPSYDGPLMYEQAVLEAHNNFPNYTPAMEAEYQRLDRYQKFYELNKKTLKDIQQLNVEISKSSTGGTHTQLEERFDLMQKVHLDMLNLGYPTKPGEYILDSLHEEYELRDRYQKILEKEGTGSAKEKLKALQNMDDIGHETLFGARLFGARKFLVSERERLRKKLMKEKLIVLKK